MRAAGRFSSDVDPTATHPATGQARAAGWGESILKGGVPLPFWASQRMLLTAGPMSVDLEGRGWHDRWWWNGDRGHKGVDGRSKYVVIKRVVITRKVQNGQTVSRRKVVTVKRRWDWDRRTNGATWRLNGHASGSVTLATRRQATISSSHFARTAAIAATARRGTRCCAADTTIRRAGACTTARRASGTRRRTSS